MMKFLLLGILCCSFYWGCSNSVEFGEETYGQPIVVNFSEGSLFAPGGVILEPPISDKGFVERCTFDGSKPNAETEIFNEAKEIKWNAVVRCTKFWKDSVPSSSQVRFYFVGQRKKMPVLALAVDPDYFENYLSAPPCSPSPCSDAIFWEDVEVPVFIEYFPEGGYSDGPAFSKNAGLKISGGWSRNQEKKSITIVMRKQYEKGRIDYPLFETRPENSHFKSFLLRNNGNRYVSDYFVDAMGASLLEGTGLDYQRSRLVVVFVNGSYQGIYDMCEKENEHYVENNYGINSDIVNVVKHVHNRIDTKNGSAEGYRKMLRYAVNHDFGGAHNKAYEEIGEMVDLPNYANYMAAEIYYHNGDWPNNNVRAWNAPGLPWKFMVYDLDHGFDWTNFISDFSRNMNMIQWIMRGGADGYPCYGKVSENCFHSLFVSLIKNPDFKRMFLNHASVLYAGFVNGEKASAAIDKMYASLDLNEVERDLKAFPRRGYTNSCGGNFDVSGACARQWMYQRDSTVWEDFRQGLNLGEKVLVEFEPVENGTLYIEDILLPQSGLKAQFFVDNEILIRAEAAPSHEFVSWMDGSTENPRLITPKKGLKIKALFQ